MANTMDVNVAGCILQWDRHPPITARFYTGAATALNAEATYPRDKGGILSTSSYQLAAPPAVGMLWKWKDIDTYDSPVIEKVADGDNGNLIVGIITWVPAMVDLSSTYCEVAAYQFQDGDILKLLSSDNASATAPSHSDGVSLYTGERAFTQDNTNGVGFVIKSAPAKGDDFLLRWMAAGNVL